MGDGYGGMPGDMGGGYGTPPSDEFGNPMDEVHQWRSMAMEDPYGPMDYDFGGFGPVDEPEFTAFDFSNFAPHDQGEDEAVAYADISDNTISWTGNDDTEIYDNVGVSLRTKPMDQGMSDPWGPSNEDRSFVYIVDPSNSETVPLKLKDDWGGALQNESCDDFSREYIAVTSDGDGYVLMKESFLIIGLVIKRKNIELEQFSGYCKLEYKTMEYQRPGRRGEIWSRSRW